MGRQGDGFKVMLVSRVCSCMGRTQDSSFFAIVLLDFLDRVARNRENSPVTSVSRYLFFPCAPSVNKSTRVFEEATHFFLLLHPSFSSSSTTGLRDTPSRGMSALFYPAQWLSLRLTQAHSTLAGKQTSLSPHASSAPFPLCAGGRGHCSHWTCPGAEIQGWD